MDTTDNIERLIQIEDEAFQAIQEAEDKASQLLREVRAQSE
jgi:vacuolar-type H+-ATPase subunit H